MKNTNILFRTIATIVAIAAALVSGTAKSNIAIGDVHIRYIQGGSSFCTTCANTSGVCTETQESSPCTANVVIGSGAPTVVRGWNHTCSIRLFNFHSMPVCTKTIPAGSIIQN